MGTAVHANCISYCGLAVFDQVFIVNTMEMHSLLYLFTRQDPNDEHIMITLAGLTYFCFSCIGIPKLFEPKPQSSFE